MEFRPIRNHELRTPITLISGHAQGLLRRAPQSSALLLHVIDRGPGVPSEEREAIFGRFVRGSGIGLSVVRLLIETMGGRVQVAAHPGGGADVQLVLPGLANP